MKSEEKFKKHSNRHKHDLVWIGEAYSLLCKICKKLSIPGKPKSKHNRTKGCFGKKKEKY